ncbi:MAG: hypothetical protein WKG01_25440 [Kofleriaceae bacterium]
MRPLVCVLWLLFGAGIASAQRAAPVRVAIECEEEGRTKMCPAFLLGFVDANKVLLASPRAGADVVVYATATEVALVDRVNLRFVGRMPGAPPVVELVVDVDSRGTDDAQRAQLEPTFLRGISLFVAARYPNAVAVTLTAPAEVTAGAASAGSPWGLLVEIGANGNYTEKFQSASGNLNVVGRWVTKQRRALAGAFSSAGLNRQPPLMLEDGTLVSLDSKQWFVRPGAEFIEVLNKHWSAGAGSFTSFEDPKGQYKYTNRTRAALEWDRFQPDDPRGNRLGVFYSLGWVTERYNVRNVRGEGFASFPVHGLNAIGAVRYDKISLGLELQLEAQLLHPTRRFSAQVSPEIEVKLGDHVDLSLEFRLKQRTFPAPDITLIDPLDYEQQSRLSYAEPLTLSGSLSLTFHWDPTNGVRNNRIEQI